MGPLQACFLIKPKISQNHFIIQCFLCGLPSGLRNKFLRARSCGRPMFPDVFENQVVVYLWQRHYQIVLQFCAAKPEQEEVLSYITLHNRYCIQASFLFCPVQLSACTFVRSWRLSSSSAFLKAFLLGVQAALVLRLVAFSSFIIFHHSSPHPCILI